MFRFIILLVFVSCVFFPSLCGADDNSFKAKNPDIDKYPFVKNFITGLGYYHRVAIRLKAEADMPATAETEMKAIQLFIDNRTMDNTELRIARNYVTQFTSSRNGLIRKLAQDTIVTYDKLIAMSVEERGLWQAFLDFKKQQDSQRIDEGDFIRQQTEIALDKKEVAKGLLEACRIIHTVLLSAEKCESEECSHLAVTQKERDKLLEKLDAFAGSNMAWGMKEGQSTVEACEAAIREILEDRIYLSK
ncbi:MAG: hypothetical protein HQL21_01680 [Candidatus Omnitrophica bacterium]|nr:hypothetical protein [Candidatus Omnitrophota bacterium]